jgi:3-oxoacyl-[acyl-carrier protein] reductase
MTLSDHKRVVIVTGASRGLGREIALRFGRAGERVVVNYLTLEKEAIVVASAISQAGGDAVPIQADVRNAAAIDAMIADTVKRWGTVDILVNNAGMTKDRLILRMSEQDWDDVVDTNLTGGFHCIRAVSKFMVKQHQGHIINVASIVGLQGREGQANYAASKAGLAGLTKASAKELGRFNIKVNAVLPGYLPTYMGNTISNVMRNRILKENALNRCSDPQEVAQFVYNLSLMKNVSGQVFNIDSRVV